MWDVHPGSGFFFHLDPGVKKAPDLWSATLIFPFNLSWAATVLFNSVADPGSGAFDPWIRIRTRDKFFGSRITNHISVSLVVIVWVKNRVLKSFVNWLKPFLLYLRKNKIIENFLKFIIKSFIFSIFKLFCACYFHVEFAILLEKLKSFIIVLAQKKGVYQSGSTFESK